MIVTVLGPGDPPKNIRGGNGSSQIIVLRTFNRGHGPDIPARGNDSSGGIINITGDGFGSGFGCRSNGFHQLFGRVVSVAGCDAIFVGFSQGPAAHPFCGTGSAIGLRSFGKFELGVVLVVFGRNQRPFISCMNILFHPCGGAVFSDVLDGSGTLARNNAPVCLHS